MQTPFGKVARRAHDSGTRDSVDGHYMSVWEGTADTVHVRNIWALVLCSLLRLHCTLSCLPIPQKP